MTQGLSILENIDQWIARGWLSHLNRAFVRFLLDQDNESSDEVLWAGALVSHQLDRGEVYLDLEKLCQQPGLTLAIPTDDAWKVEHEFALRELSALQVYSLQQWLSALRQSKLIALEQGNTPLVLEGNRLYLRRYWHYQQTLNTSIQQRLLPIRECLPIALLNQSTALFPAIPESPKIPDWQKIACVLALRSRFTIITGGPGTGKTTTLTKLLALLINLTQYESNNTKKLNILLAAPTGKAAARVSESIGKALDNLNVNEDIKQSIPKKASTLHRLLGSRHDSRRFIHNRDNVGTFLFLPVFAAIRGVIDKAEFSDHPAIILVNKENIIINLVFSRALINPGSAAIAGMDNGAEISGSPAVALVYKHQGKEMTGYAGLLFNPGLAAVRGVQHGSSPPAYPADSG